MSNPFQPLRDICERHLADKERDEQRDKQSLEELREAKYQSFQACSPTVQKVLTQLREALYRKLELQTKAESQKSYYSWGIGEWKNYYTGDYPCTDTAKSFSCVVEVKPKWSEQGEIAGLLCMLKLGTCDRLADLAREHGLEFAAGGATMTATIECGLSEQDLVKTLGKLHPPELVQKVLGELH